MPPKVKKEAFVRALDKALGILEHFGRIRDEVNLATLAKQTGMPKSTLLRLLNTLKSHNFVNQNHYSRRYQLGWALIYLGKAAAQYYNLPAIVHPFLEQLAVQTGETTSLVVLDKDHAIYIDQVASDNLIRGIPSVGSRLALHCTASGKVLLSGFSHKDFHRFLRTSVFEKKTDRTITKLRALSNEIRKVKRQGYAVDDEETEVGGRCLGAPIFDKEGRIVAAISVIGPANRIKKGLFGKLSIQVRKAAAQASAALGHEGKIAG